MWKILNKWVWGDKIFTGAVLIFGNIMCINVQHVHHRQDLLHIKCYPISSNAWDRTLKCGYYCWRNGGARSWLRRRGYPVH